MQTEYQNSVPRVKSLRLTENSKGSHDADDASEGFMEAIVISGLFFDVSGVAVGSELSDFAFLLQS